MLRIELSPDVARRLAAFLASPGVAPLRTDHWFRYGRLNGVDVVGRYAVVRAGAGFDSEYELNFRRPSFRERAGMVARAIAARSDLRKYRSAYETLWNEPPQTARSPHEIVAQHYMRLLQPYRVGTYLEIGAGTGYLAALAHQLWRARIIIIDLPEILPLGFLYLHKRFPDASFSLPNEEGCADFTFMTCGDGIADDSVDLAVNTASFGEMKKTAIERYFRLLRRVLRPRGIFFTVNREEKVMDGIPIRFADYPWSVEDVDLASGTSRLHDLTQPRNRMLMRLTHLAKCATSDTSPSITAQV